MEKSLNYKPVFFISIIIAFICHSIIFSIFNLSFKKYQTFENPYFLSLGAIIPQEDFVSLNNTANDLSEYQFIKYHLPPAKTLNNNELKRTQLMKPYNKISSGVQNKNTSKTTFSINKENIMFKHEIMQDNDFNIEAYKPLQLP